MEDGRREGRMQRKHCGSYILAKHFHHLNSMLDGMPIQKPGFAVSARYRKKVDDPRLHVSVRQ